MTYGWRHLGSRNPHSNQDEEMSTSHLMKGQSPKRDESLPFDKGEQGRYR
jgi:hypothetical protein